MVELKERDSRKNISISLSQLVKKSQIKMNIKLIKNESEYEAALAEVERLFNARPGTPEKDRLEILVNRVEAYEDAYYSIPPANWLDRIIYFLKSRGVIHP